MITYPSCRQQEVGGGVHWARCVRDLPLTQGHAHYSCHVGLWAKHVDWDSQGVSCDQSKHAITILISDKQVKALTNVRFHAFSSSGKYVLRHYLSNEGKDNLSL